MARDRLDTGMFISRKNVPKALRQLLGEVDDPAEAYLGKLLTLHSLQQLMITLAL